MSGATPGQVSLSPGPSVPVVPGTDPGTIRALEGAIEALREQLAKADQREESEHRWRELANSSLVAERERAERSEGRADELQVALTEERPRVEAGRQLVEDGRKWIASCSSGSTSCTPRLPMPSLPNGSPRARPPLCTLS